MFHEILIMVNLVEKHPDWKGEMFMCFLSADKMRAIDEEFEERERANERSLAERLTEMGRQMEMRYEERLNEEMSRVREREVTQVRLELEERMRQQTATIK